VESWIYSKLFVSRVAFEVVSVGCLPSGYVYEGALEAMAEKGLDLREAKSQHMDEYLDGLQLSCE
jgi:protein-tyrosine-phosphatase